MKFQVLMRILRTKFDGKKKCDVKTRELAVSLKYFNKSNFVRNIFNIINIKLKKKTKNWTCKLQTSVIRRRPHCQN